MKTREFLRLTLKYPIHQYTYNFDETYKILIYRAGDRNTIFTIKDPYLRIVKERGTDKIVSVEEKVI